MEAEKHYTIQVAVLIPLFQSITTGSAFGSVVLAAGELSGRSDALWIAAVVLAVTTAITWLILLRRWLDAASWGDGYTYSHTRTQEPVRLELESEDGRHVAIIDLPASQEQLMALASGILSGASLSESTWCGSGAPFSRSEFAQLRAELIKRGLAAWSSPRTPARGIVLTKPGEAAMRYFASLADDPPSLKRVNH